MIAKRLSYTPVASGFADDITIVEYSFAIEDIGDMSRELDIGKCSDSDIRFLTKLREKCNTTRYTHAKEWG